MSAEIVVLILLVIADLAVTALLFREVVLKLKDICFNLLRIELIYNSVDRIECSCNGIKALLVNIPEETSSRLRDEFADRLRPTEAVVSHCEFENDVKNVMEYSPSPKKRKEIKRKVTDK